MITVLLLLGSVIFMVPVSDTIRRGGIAFLVLAIAAMSLVLALQRRAPLALRIVSAFFALLPARLRERADAALHGFIDGLQALGHGAALVRIALRLCGRSPGLGSPPAVCRSRPSAALALDHRRCGVGRRRWLHRHSRRGASSRSPSSHRLLCTYSG
jgi:hypothetical protein